MITPLVIEGQISGYVKDAKGQPLPFATIYIEGTSKGTVCNSEGFYELEIKDIQNFVVTYQYIGYNTQKHRIQYQGKAISLHVIMYEQETLLEELTITADREDPAYPIIRQAIKKRQYFKSQNRSIEADIYAKGVVKITQSPKKVLGSEVGTLGGRLDSTGRGIVYLSESKSKYYYQFPNKTKEVMVSSVTSGSNSLFSANQFGWASFDIYNEYLNFSRSIVSPIADNAFSYYQYSLEQTIIDPNGLNISKIKIIPKSKNEPLLSGYIYITNDIWNIQSTDLLLFGPVLKNTFLDTIAIRQMYIPVAEPDRWALMSQVIHFKAGTFGFKFGGNFTYVFSDYKLDKNLNDIFTDNEIFKVDKKALNRDSAFWTAVRPVPLTYEELHDYEKQDSILKHKETKAYKDSIDRKNNKFLPIHLLSGYTWRNSFKKVSVAFPNPLSSIQFNAVEGWKADFKFAFNTMDTLFRRWTVEPRCQYGFADKNFKPSLKAEYRFDNYNLGYITTQIGRKYEQFDQRLPVSEFSNTYASLWDKLNGIKLFDENFAEFGIRREIFNGFFVDFQTSWISRKPLYINTQYSIRKPHALYEENIPQHNLAPVSLAANKYWRNKLNVLIRPGQKYSSYPNYKDRDVSDWPNIEIEYESGIPLDQKSAQYNKITLGVRDFYLNLRIIGYSSYNIEGGKFLGNKPSFFADFFHPMGNVLLMPTAPGLRNFNLLPYYTFSTNQYYTQINFRHHFNGFITDKIPLLNKTSLKLVAGFSGLNTPDSGDYFETFLGFENFKIGPFHLFDLDYTWSFDKHGFRDRGPTLRLAKIFD
jgi:hypothetical protein